MTEKEYQDKLRAYVGHRKRMKQIEDELKESDFYHPIDASYDITSNTYRVQLYEQDDKGQGGLIFEAVNDHKMVAMLDDVRLVYLTDDIKAAQFKSLQRLVVNLKEQLDHKDAYIAKLIGYKDDDVGVGLTD